MDSLNPDVLTLVSYHAVTRYVQRVMDVTVPWAEPPLLAAEIAEAHCLTAGTTIEAVRGLILTPVVLAAQQMGITRVRCGTLTVFLSPKGVVTTVKVYDPPQTKRLRVLSRREDRKRSHAFSKRMRRRPASEGKP